MSLVDESEDDIIFCDVRYVAVKKQHKNGLNLHHCGFSHYHVCFRILHQKLSDRSPPSPGEPAVKAFEIDHRRVVFPADVSYPRVWVYPFEFPQISQVANRRNPPRSLGFDSKPKGFRFQTFSPHWAPKLLPIIQELHRKTFFSFLAAGV